MSKTTFLCFLLIQSPVVFSSAADCAAEADRASRGTGSGIGQAGSGAVKGALFGVVVGDNRKAASRGALLGAITGGLRHGVDKNNVYTSVYDSCMRRR